MEKGVHTEVIILKCMYIHSRGVMTWNGLQTSENDKDRGDKQVVT